MSIKFPGTLHAHTDYSNERLRDCINTVPSLIDKAIELGHEVVAITDHETISSYVKVEEYYEKVKEKYPNFKVIRGNEIYLTRNGLNGDNFSKERGDKYFHFILLCKDLEGYHQICQLSTKAYNRSYISQRMRRVPTYYQDIKDIVLPNKGHLIASSACLGSQIDAYLLNYKNTGDEEYYDLAKRWAVYIQNIFGEGNFFLELQPSNGAEQVFVNKHLIKISEELNIPYIITLDAHYLRPEDANIHEAFLNAQDGDREVKSFYETTYMMNDEEVRNFFSYLTEEQLQYAYSNIVKIKNACEDFSIKRPLKIPSLMWRKFEDYSEEELSFYSSKMPSLIKFVNSPYKSDNMLVNAVIEGVKNKTDLQNDEAYQALEECLDMTWVSSEVNKARWSAYYLNLQKILNECWNAGTIIGISRGCFIPEMKVSMEDGRIKRIADVEIGEKVFTHTGEIHTVKNKFAYDVKEKLYRIKISGTEDIVCTNNHKIFGIHNIYCKYKDNCVLTCKRKCNIKEGLKPEWIEAQDLSVNDMLAIPRYKYPQKSIERIDLADYTEKINYCSWDEDYIYTYYGNNTIRVAKKYKRFIPIDKDFLYFLGVFIGDGWVKKAENNRELGLCFNSSTEKDQKSQERIIQYLERMEMPYQLIEGQNGKQVNQIRFVNPFLGFFLNEECGHGAENKHIPKMFLYDNYEEMQELFWGLMNSDGSIDSKRRRICYDTINFDLANQVRNLLSYLGVYSSIITREPKDNREEFKNTKTSYKVCATGKQLNIFPFVDFQVSRNVIQRDDNYFYPRVKEISIEDYEGTVYDLSVEKDTSYVINNIAVHNSGGGFLLLYALDIIQMNKLKETTQLYPWRFLNPERVSVLDIDCDISGMKRAQVLKHLYEVYKDRVCNVATFKLEKSKSAIQTAARGLGIDVDIAQYISSLVTVERRMPYTLKQMYYGDKDNGIEPNKTFINEINKYTGLWEIANRIEGLICGVGVHAGGIVFVDEPFTNTTALMRAPDGTLISQMELHDLEKLSLIKYDLLSVEGMDRIQTCLELLVEYGYVEKKSTLKETYESAIGTYKIERNSPKMWEMVWNHEITSLFQMEQQSGVQGIALTKPKNVDDLATLNSIIRLMAQEKGAETPLETYTRFRQDKNAFDDEMKSYGLTDEERLILHRELDVSSGLCIAQEQFMKLVQLPECGGWDLQWSDKLRKAIAKKQAKDFYTLEEMFFARVKERHLSENFCNYVWNRQIALSRGYGFNSAHTLGYSLVALQEMNLAYNYPIIFWNTACLIVDSAGVKEEDDDDEEEIVVEEEEQIVSIYEPEEWEDYEYEDLPDRSGKKKKKTKTVDYDKIASAIGKFKSYGIKVSPPDINTSTYTFTPNVKENTIMYGLRGISRISTDLVNTIINNRPYSSVNDFMSRIKVNKTQMVNLIKCGAFDNIEGKERSEIMNNYISSIADHKNKLTLSNMPALIEKNLIPDEMTKYKKIFLFNKHLKQDCKRDVYYILGQKEINFITNNFDADLLIDGDKVSQKKWDNCYSKSMEPMRVFLKENMDELLNSLNNSYFEEENSKYANGNISKWEMESLSFYYHKHELDYGNSTFDNFFDLPEVPIVEQSFQTKDGNTINIYRLNIIAGTVIARDKNKNMVTLLTQYGVVNVKVYKNQFAMFDKQISCVDDEGNKKVIEKSWFSRGNLLMIQGFRRGQNFVPKKYKSSIYPVISKITKVNENDSVELQYERIEVSNAE